MACIEAPSPPRTVANTESIFRPSAPPHDGQADVSAPSVRRTRRSTGSAIIIPDIVVSQEANSDRISQSYFGPVPLSIPVGETIQAGVCVNAASATVTIRELGVIMYAFS